MGFMFVRLEFVHNTTNNLVLQQQRHQQPSTPPPAIDVRTKFESRRALKASVRAHVCVCECVCVCVHMTAIITLTVGVLTHPRPPTKRHRLTHAHQREAVASRSSGGSLGFIATVCDHRRLLLHHHDHHHNYHHYHLHMHLYVCALKASVRNPLTLT